MGRQGTTLSFPTVHRQLQDIAIFGALGKLYAQEASTSKVMTEKMADLFHGNKARGMMSTATDTLSSDPICENVRNIWEETEIRAEPRRILTSVLTGGSTYCQTDFDPQCLHYSKRSYDSSKDIPLSGRCVLKRGQDILSGVKKLYALWNKVIPDGGEFASGKNEFDYLNEVLMKVHAASASSTNEKSTESTKNVSAEEEEVDLPSVQKDGDSSWQDYIPQYWWVFVVFGPFAAKHWGVDVHPLIAIDTDSARRTITGGRKAQREAEITVKMAGDGNKKESKMTEFQTRLLENNAWDAQLMSLKMELDVSKEMFDEACELNLTNEKIEWYNKRKELFKKLESLGLRFETASQALTSCSTDFSRSLRSVNEEMVSDAVREYTATESIAVQDTSESMIPRKRSQNVTEGTGRKAGQKR